MGTTPRLTPGATVTTRQLTTMTGEQVALPDPDRLVHLQFRRFAGCPVCNLHLRSIITQLDTIEAAGVTEIVVFHSTAEDLLQYEADLPFPVIADPRKRLYAEFGVDTAVRALLDPRAYLPMLRGLAHDIWSVLRGRKRVPSLRPDGGFLGLPADLLIASDGRVVAAKYGEFNFDQWTVRELLDHVGRYRTSRAVETAGNGG